MRAKKDIVRIRNREDANKGVIWETSCFDIIFLIKNSFVFSLRLYARCKKKTKKQKKRNMEISSHFSSLLQNEGIFSRYEILLVYYLKSDSAATTFDFFQLAMRSQRFAKTLRILDKVNFIGEKCGQSSFWNSVIDILSPFIRRSPRRRLSVLDRLFINTRSMSPLSLSRLAGIWKLTRAVEQIFFRRSICPRPCILRPFFVKML